MAQNAQNDLQKILKINNIIRYFINKDDLIGKVYETVESNVNTEYKLSYKDLSENRNKNIKLNEVKELIENFNEQINLKALIRKSIPVAYIEGNYPMYLRKNGNSYIVDYYPLSVIEVSDYEADGEPCLLCNINELKSRLSKTYKKTRKNKALFFKDIEEDILNNYPVEVYKAYKEKENYAKLDLRYSGMLRTNNIGRKYGISPMFKSLKSAIMLETFEKADDINARARAKKIIFQKLRKESLGKEYEKDSISEMCYAHSNLMSAWKNQTVVCTAPAFVESLEYIEPKTENINTDSIQYYRGKMMTSLGIGFLNQDTKTSFTIANLSIRELMRTINKIGEQLEDVIQKWYKLILLENGYPIELAPKIKIIDSEMMDIEVRKSLAETLFSKMNCSYETSLKLLGVDLEDEVQKRKSENDSKIQDIFTPYGSQYTNSGKDSNNNGRPEEQNDKEFKDYNLEKTQ